MLSPATLAALHRLIAILLALIEALAAPVDGAPRPLATRLATRAFSAYLKRLTAHLTETADQTTADPAPQPSPPPPQFRSSHAAAYHPIPITAHAERKPIHVKIERVASASQHAQFITIS